MGRETLGKFGVPLQGGGGRGMMRQPKPQYRYRVTFFDFGFPGDISDALTLDTNTCERPKIDYSIQPVHGYNSIAYYAGKHEWQPITCVVRDSIDNEVITLTSHQLQMQLDHFNQIGFASAVDYKFCMEIESLDGSDDGTLDKWHLEGCFLSNISDSDLDFSASEPLTISMTVRYDNAFRTDANGQLLTAPTGTTGTGVIL